MASTLSTPRLSGENAAHGIVARSQYTNHAHFQQDHLSGKTLEREFVELVSLATNRVPEFKEYSIGSIVAPLQRHSEHHWTSYRGVFPNIGNNR